MHLLSESLKEPLKKQESIETDEEDAELEKELNEELKSFEVDNCIWTLFLFSLLSLIIPNLFPGRGESRQGQGAGQFTGSQVKDYKGIKKRKNVCIVEMNVNYYYV